MENQELELLKKKQELISTYYDKINVWKKDRSGINTKIKKAEARFAELVRVEAGAEQLELFGDLDQYINENPGLEIPE
ncbi:hypothetical protein SAMN05192574_101398 [Mucilaginibacter gossypiicola]|uniref:Uncharacterized protein n=1 Tax=Mucilaginibacter gossypiicola TaxID=551995 RepID=A0A1H8AA46_9SPHI|nr:hypothetical protein [Mucilaginibacter gossypiicola]SEM66669.1 hypothetical protein SAMN05192574_101398 [Mucilaginibacter gossypiicola]